MKKPNQEQIKIMLIVILSIVFVLVAYFRFFQNKSIRATAVNVKPPAASLAAPHIHPGPGAEKPKEASGEGFPVARTVTRNIFEPAKAAVGKDGAKAPSLEKAEGSAPPPLKLSGTIADDRSAIAIINKKFLRKGDWIEGYQVARIGDNEVLLIGDGRKIVLNVTTMMEKKTRNP
jgi:hypothetical protein